MGYEPTEYPVNRGLAGLRPLPTPDLLETLMPDGFICLLTDDGTDLTSSLAKSLTDNGWKVVVMSYPAAMIPRQSPLAGGFSQIQLVDVSEDHLGQRLAEINATFGPVGAFIHLNPPEISSSGKELRPGDEKSIVKHIFLLAKHLKNSLNDAANTGRGVFMSVIHLDGEFGLSGNIDFDPISGGLFGLVKTLNLEWEPVFCRALDLDPAYDVETSVQHIIAEILDPNRLVAEVGYSQSHGRQTLVVEPGTGLGGKK